MGLSNEEALERFKVEYQMYHGIAPLSVYHTERTLLAFTRDTGKPLLEANAEDVRTWITGFISNGAKPTTAIQYLKRLRSFYNWAYEANQVTAETYMQIRALKKPRKQAGADRPRPYSVTELNELRRQIDERWPYVEPRHWSRFRRGVGRYHQIQPEVCRYMVETIMTLALHCGLRRAEIFNLTLDAMHPDNESLVVVRKGGKVREVPHTESSRSMLRRWLTVRSLLNPPHDEPWLNVFRKARAELWQQPISFYNFIRIFPNIGDGWELHRLRHTCGTNWLRSGMKLEIVSKLMGHSSIYQTMGYAELVNSDVQQSVKVNERKFLSLTGERAADEIDNDERSQAALDAAFGS